MSTIKSSTEHLTLNADGAGKEIKFQANGVEKASISSAGAFTSTSIDATKLSGALPAIDGSALSGVGKVLQVVQGTSINQSSTTSTSYISTTLGATITPTSASSKIMVIISTSYYHSYPNYGAYFTILRNGSNVVGAAGWGDWYNNSGLNRVGIALSYMDSPATTATTSYSLGMKAESSSYTVYSPSGSGSLGTITLMEIGA